MPQNFKNFIFVFIVLLLFTNIQSIRAEEKAIQQGLSTEEWMRCAAKVIDEFDDPVKECMKWTYSQAEYKNCEKIKNERKEAFDKEIEGRCGIAPKGKSISQNPTEQSVQDQFSNNNSSGIPNYTQALVIELPKESDFQKIPKSDFEKVNPVSTASASPKPATRSANITDGIFIGKVGGEGEIIVDLPGGKTVTLTDDQTALDGEISGWRFLRDFNQSPKPNPFQARVIMRDCHLDIRPANQDRWASDWGVDTVISTGNCNYNIGGDPTRIIVNTGKVNLKIPSGVGVSAQNSDFGISVETESGQSIIEVYNGSITVINKAGQSKTISTIYGSQINRIEVDKDGVMNEKIAIPQSQWEEFLASNQKGKKETNIGSNFPVVPAVAMLITGGIIFFLYRTGKLIPLYKISNQKITEILKKIRREKKID